MSTVAPSVDPRTGKRFSYFAEPNHTSVAATLRPSLSADFLSHVGKPALTLPAAWRTRNGIPDRDVNASAIVTERVIESEKIERGNLSRPGSDHELNTALTKESVKPRTKSVDGTAMMTTVPKTLVSTGVLTERDVPPSKVNRKLQVNIALPWSWTVFQCNCVTSSGAHWEQATLEKSSGTSLGIHKLI